MNKERLTDSTTNADFDLENSHKYQYLSSKLEDQNKTLKGANRMGNEIIKTQTMTMSELEKQKNQ